MFSPFRSGIFFPLTPRSVRHPDPLPVSFKEPLNIGFPRKHRMGEVLPLPLPGTRVIRKKAIVRVSLKLFLKKLIFYVNLNTGPADKKLIFYGRVDPLRHQGRIVRVRIHATMTGPFGQNMKKFGKIRFFLSFAGVPPPLCFSGWVRTGHVPAMKLKLTVRKNPCIMVGPPIESNLADGKNIMIFSQNTADKQHILRTPCPLDTNLADPVIKHGR